MTHLQPQHQPYRWPSLLLVTCALVGAVALGAPRPGEAQGLPPASIFTGVLFEQLTLAGGGEASSSTPGLAAEVGAGLPLSDRDLLGVLALRVGMDDERDPRLATHLFLRTSAGHDDWKTFFDAGLLARIQPAWSVGARLGIGLQHELSEHVGLFLTAGGTAGYGERFHVSFDGGLGLQVRFGASAAHHSIHWYEH